MKKILDYSFFKLDKLSLSLSSIIGIVILIFAVFIILKIIKKSLHRSNKIDIGKKYTIFQLIKYVVTLFTFVVCLQMLGFNITVLLASSAALLVGLGLGLQHLFSDFISGIIILLDSSIAVGDIIEVNNMICKVQKINLRTTIVIGRDENYIIIPNTDLTRGHIVNWTHDKVSSRFRIHVGVSYASDVDLVMKLLKEAAMAHPKIAKTPPPFVRFSDYGESSLNFSVFFWSDEVYRIENIKSQIRIEIFKKFKENNVEIPFPQRVLHLKKND